MMDALCHNPERRGRLWLMNPCTQRRRTKEFGNLGGHLMYSKCELRRSIYHKLGGPKGKVRASKLQSLGFKT